jgi:hypothetical protein
LLERGGFSAPGGDGIQFIPASSDECVASRNDLTANEAGELLSDLRQFRIFAGESKPADDKNFGHGTELSH